MQQSDRGAADAAAGPGDHDLAIFRTNPGVFQCHHAQHRGETGGPNDHGLTTIQALRHRHQPVAFNASALRKAAPVVFTHAPSCQQHLMAGVETRILATVDKTGKIDARNHRKVADNFSFTGDGQRIFIVQAGPVDIHCHIALRQLAGVNGLHRRESFAILLF